MDDRPIMLALSTFRQSEKAVDIALQKARGKRLIVVHVVDKNLARYLVGMDVGLYPDIKHICEEEVLKGHKRDAEKRANAIVERAEKEGIKASARVRVGRFAQVCLDVIRQETPETVVTTRSKRPAWVKRLFGSPVDHLIEHAGCSVLEA